MFWSEHLEKDGQNSAPTGGFLFYFDDTVARITANERRLVQMYIQLLSVCNAVTFSRWHHVLVMKYPEIALLLLF